jgi:hypothetical protein
LWKGPIKWFGNVAMLGGLIGVVVHFMRYGRKRVEEVQDAERSRT